MKTLIFSALCSVALGSTVVAPFTQATAAGNATSSIPVGTNSLELQEDIGSGQMPPGVIQISGLSFRAAPGKGAVNMTTGNLVLTLSTTQNYPNTNGGKTLQSATFASNVGPDKTVVFSGSNVTFSDPGCAGPTTPCAFDLNITFKTPFFYNSSQGSLLVDLALTNFTATSGAFDQESFTGPPGGSVSQVIGPLGSATGTFSYQANVVQFTYTVPLNLSIQTGGVVNTASQANQLLPNGTIAQGGVFTVYLAGTLPVPSQLLSSYPVGTTFNNISMNVNMGGTNIPVLMFGCSPYPGGTVVDGILPSTTPLGNGSISVSYNGQTGTSAPITVVANNFAWFTNNAGGSGPGAFTDVAGATLSPLHSTHPGDVIIGYGTGLGAAPTNDTNGGHVVIAPSDVKLWVGPVQVPSSGIDFMGRASSAGEDQINFHVPAGILGCTVPVILQIGNNVSNSATISIASSGSNCNDSFPAVGTLSSDLDLVNSKGSFSSGQILLFRYVGQGDGVSGSFTNVSPLNLLLGTHLDVPSVGTCTVSTTGGGGNSSTGLDAGAAALSVKGPSGTFPIPPKNSGNLGHYGNQIDSTNSLFNPGSTVTVASTGGPGVGSFSSSLTLGTPPVWTNQNSITTINRSQGVSLTWSGGTASGFAVIQAEIQGGSLDVLMTCAAPALAGQFSVPPSALLALPATGNGLTGTIAILFTNAFGSFSATGLDAGYIVSIVGNQINAVYQ